MKRPTVWPAEHEIILSDVIRSEQQPLLDLPGAMGPKCGNGASVETD
jgi:hypothetical protein